MSISIGQAAPNFTLFDTDKKPVSLADFKGQNVVVLFFPLLSQAFVLLNYAISEITSLSIIILMQLY